GGSAEASAEAEGSASTNQPPSASLGKGKRSTAHTLSPRSQETYPRCNGRLSAENRKHALASRISSRLTCTSTPARAYLSAAFVEGECAASQRHAATAVKQGSQAASVSRRRRSA